MDLDTLLDRSIVGGFSRIGYGLRRRAWPDGGALPRLDGRTVAITGPTSGLGRAAAVGAHALGARVLLLVRSLERGRALAAELGGGPDRATVIHCDLASLASVRSAIVEVRGTAPRLDVLINNAGALPAERTETGDGIELTFATNVVGPFLLSTGLLPALEAAAAASPGQGRVITVASGGMYGQAIHVDDLQMADGPFNGVTAYARTKRAEVILTELWAERWRASGVTAHAMHPGWADTPGVRESLPRFHALTRPILRSPEQGADTILWLAGAPAAEIGSGGFWHDRRRRPTHVLDRTRETAQDRSRLWDAVSALASGATVSA